MQQRIVCAGSDQASSGLGRRFSALGCASAVALSLGVPSAAVFAQANPPKPPPPPTLDSCWAEFKSAVDECSEFATKTNSLGWEVIDEDLWQACLSGARALLSTCLGQAPAPEVPRTRNGCRQRFRELLRECEKLSPPLITNPDSPVGPSIPSARNLALLECINGALAWVNRCYQQSPPLAGVVAEASPRFINVEPFAKYATISLRTWRTDESALPKRVGLSVDLPTADVAGGWLEFDYPASPSWLCENLPVISDQATAGAALISGSLATQEVRVALPMDLYEARSDGFFLYHRFESATGEVLGIAPVWIAINWHWADRNRDGGFSSDDVMNALDEFFAERLDEASLRAIILHVDTHRCP